MAQENVTAEEVWDDSALVNSWNEAYEEYKKYHSLALKGEKIILKTEQAANNLLDGEPPVKEEQLDHPDPNDVSRESSIEDQASTGAAPQVLVPPAIPVDAALPPGLAETVSNQDMKSLIMSWYYAGYYTGLYEGKQQGYAAAQQEQQGGVNLPTLKIRIGKLVSSKEVLERFDISMKYLVIMFKVLK